MASRQDERKRQLVWRPQPGPQTLLVRCPAPEIFFGGSRGGGKTDGVLGKWLVKDGRYGTHFNAMMLRRTTVSSIDAIERSRQIYGLLGGRFFESKPGSPLTWRMPNGGRVGFAYLDTVSDAQEYQGRNLTDVWVEECGQYPDPAPIWRMFGTLRSAQGVPVQLVLTGNPGGPGQRWIRDRYELSPFPKRAKILKRVVGDGVEHEVAVIPSRLSDNLLLLRRDPGYVARLHLVGKDALVRAWLEGDWNAVEGAFFDEWSESKHVVEDFEVPGDWLRFRSMDWGSARPFSVGWWAVVGDDYLVGGKTLPRGALVRYREWYGCVKGQANVGLKLPAEEVGRGIRDRERGEDVRFGVLDPSAFREDGGPSIAEMMRRVGGWKGPSFWRADNTRVGKLGAVSGWAAVRARLRGLDGVPMLYVQRGCEALISTMPLLQHDAARIEDLDCWVAGTLVSTPAGEVPIEAVEPGQVVDTPIGPCKALAVYCSGSGATCWARLSDGRVLRGTPHHEVYVEGRGLTALNDLECHMVLKGRTTWRNGLSGLRMAVLFTRAIRDGFTTIRMGLFSWVGARVCTGRFGWMLGERSLMGGMFTTLTGITTTMFLGTLPVCRQGSMRGSTFESVFPVSLDGGLRYGVGRMKGGRSFERMRERCGSGPRSGHSRAFIVGLLFRRDILARSIARLPVMKRVAVGMSGLARFAARLFGRDWASARHGPVRIVAVGRSDERVPVYNLTVDVARLFYANGVLSSNTDGEDHAADDMRYACLARPWLPPRDERRVVPLMDYLPWRSDSGIEMPEIGAL